MIDAHPQLAIPPETGFLPLCHQFTSSGDMLRQEFFQLVTIHPTESPCWPDFQISSTRFWNLLTQIAPFSVVAGLRLFYQTHAARFDKSRWGDKRRCIVSLWRRSPLCFQSLILFTSSEMVEMWHCRGERCGLHLARVWRLLPPIGLPV
jgi:hypothetical protein